MHRWFVRNVPSLHQCLELVVPQWKSSPGQNSQPPLFLHHGCLFEEHGVKFVWREWDRYPERTLCCCCLSCKGICSLNRLLMDWLACRWLDWAVIAWNDSTVTLTLSHWLTAGLSKRVPKWQKIAFDCLQAFSVRCFVLLIPKAIPKDIVWERECWAFCSKDDFLINTSPHSQFPSIIPIDLIDDHLMLISVSPI